MTYQIAALLLTPFLCRASALVINDTPTVNARAVTNTSKAGLPWPNGNADDINQYLSTGKVQWYYTWSPSPTQADLEFVPMLWGTNQVDQWDGTINKTVQDLHVTHVLGFNEPEIQGQSNIDPQEGAALWKAHIEPLRGLGVQLGSPAPSGSPAGKQWLLDFMDACQGGCSVDFIAVHYYDINSTGFMEYLEDYHNTFQRSMWVTEWACQNFNNADMQCSQQDVVDFMNSTQAFMDSTDWVERYGWFGAMENLQGVNEANALMSSQGSITPLGQQYIGATVPQVDANYTPGVVHGGSGLPSGDGGSNAALLFGHTTPWQTLLLPAMVTCAMMRFAV
ncbi:glycosyl hydrolase catalytic core-domain-containing protein [Epithele typhae]|uniref:glycosyl hydrolase catalytic core-domain-containing protein n=1 Tax=Epithele typhae TaxID=378194 RepID=UPI002007C59C|nr:glycosyl hydrolase catalytic core-domain-containing protein [Epithele typhae]KAH9943114.1 glycosyl hydrolase catalytic core-domain-containing protein [Epithele typhae]